MFIIVIVLLSFTKKSITSFPDMASTDCLQLNKSPMFAKIREGLLADRRLYTQNLVECKDDLLFCWDSQQSCLLVLNWRAASTMGLDQIKYQVS